MISQKKNSINMKNTSLIVLFRKAQGINLKTRTSFVTNHLQTAFNRVNKDKLRGRKLFENVSANIRFYKELRNFRGIRHTKGLPVRGQRTHTNASPKVLKQKKFF